jgi:hypothetical protein
MKMAYKLDVRMNEVQSPSYCGYADRNLSIMRTIELKLLTDEKTSTDGITLNTESEPLFLLKSS